ncbi:hypothetical protein PINS_up005143 [Pythium insidiosum]|nr:hypothetical protein PINS_up005143 [Pythium insidiosum]
MTTASGLIILLMTAGQGLVGADGIGGGNETEICAQVEREIRGLLINSKQAAQGIEGDGVVANDCKALVDANVLNARSDEAQGELCSNSCFAKLNNKYKILLDNNCYASTDRYEAASGSLQAAAYQIACQTMPGGKYCIPLLATLINDAGSSYDICADIAKDLGCCFQSYKQYMQYGTPASIKALDDVQEKCIGKGVSGIDKPCPCGVNNAFNKYAFPGTTICSDAETMWHRSVLVAVIASAFCLINVVTAV